MLNQFFLKMNRINNRAFTLLELMITIGLLVFSVVPITNVMSESIVADLNVQFETVALTLAQEKMEEIKDAPNFAAVGGYASARLNIGGAFDDFDREVVITGDIADPTHLKKVEVIVYWTLKNVAQQISMVTLLADPSA